MWRRTQAAEGRRSIAARRAIPAIAFGALQAGLDLGYSPSIVHFTWAGFEEMDEVSGDGHAELLDDGTIEIVFAYHNSDEAVLKAKRQTSSAAC